MATTSSTVLRTAVVGATGLARQQFLAGLADHPSLQIARLAASARSAGRSYGEGVIGRCI